MSSLADQLNDNETSLYSISGLYQFTIATLVIATASLVLRFWARYLSAGVNFGLDDWLALAAFPPCATLMALVLSVQGLGLGTHTKYVPPLDLEAFSKTLYAGQLCWHVGTSLLRFSALAFYARIFHVRTNPSRIWVRVYYSVCAISAAWLVGSILMDGAFACIPISKFWDKSVQGNCASEFSLLLAGTMGSVVTDIMVVLLPLPQVFKLNMKRRKKVAVSFSFLLGYAAAFMSIGRLALCVQLGEEITKDPAFFLTPYLYWNIAEAGFSIVAICLPAIFHLTKHVRHVGPKYLIGIKTHDPISSAGSRMPMRKEPKLIDRSRQPDWDNLYDGFGFGTYVTVSGGATNRTGQKGELDKSFPPSDGITVQQDVQIAMTDYV